VSETGVYKTEGRSPPARIRLPRPLTLNVSQTAAMPNGHHGTEEEWRRLEAPLREIDAAIELFANRHEMTLGRNYHNWPERSLRWGRDPERLIQIYLEDERRLTWNVWLCVSQDRSGQRFWKQQFLRYDVPMAEIRPAIGHLLDEAFLAVSAWRPEELEPATTRGR
jgi:hypothetical protein